ncbi:MAG TPA: hypothetical protein VF846_15645 [Thermoanaerobaculia bacterium]|jgi:hypothetical protein
MGQHIKVLSVLFIIFGVLGIMVSAGLFVFGVSAAVSMLAEDSGSDAQLASGIIGGCITGVAVLFGLMSIPSVIAGWGLSRRKSWSRVLTIVLGALALPQMPLGTALGLYAIIVMFNDETKALLNA